MSSNDDVGHSNHIYYRKNKLAPTVAMRMEARSAYRQSLMHATLGRGDPLEWYNEWSLECSRAIAYNLPDVQGLPAIIDFLEAVGSKFLPSLAQHLLFQVMIDECLERASPTLTQYGNIVFSALSKNAQDLKNKSIYFAESNTENNQSSANSDTPSQSKNQRKSTKCPCQLPKNYQNRYSHPWDPEECRNVEIALTGKCIDQPNKKLPEKVIKEIKSKIHNPQFKHLIPKFVKKGWLTNDHKNKKAFLA
ncbi:hypothetical protein MFRU_060g00010 [Monilinia fructicola]|nr:hypothetical protein MFRU_060g00010 [Monilinia fructicola]